MENSGVKTDDVTGLKELLSEKSEFSQAYQHLGNKRKLRDYLVEKMDMVEPEEIVLGIKTFSYELRGRKCHKTIKDTYQYVPFLKVLSRLLSHYDVRTQERKKRMKAEKTKKSEEEARRKKDQEKLSRETKTLREREETLNEEEQEAMSEMKTADELLTDGTVKLQSALSSGSSVDPQSAKVACIMIEAAKSNQERAKRKLESVREKQREISIKHHRLLERAVPASSSPSKKRKKN